MTSRLLMANENYMKERLSVSYFLMPTDLKSLWWPISKTIAIQLSTKEHDQPIYLCSLKRPYTNVNHLESHKTW